MTQSQASDKIFLLISVFPSRDLLLRPFHHEIKQNSRFKVSRNDFHAAVFVTCFTKITSLLKSKLNGDSPFLKSARVRPVKILESDWMKISDPQRRVEL